MVQLSFNVEQMVAEAQEYIQLDPRFWNETQGAFPYYDTMVFFTKDDEMLTLEVGGYVVTVLLD